VNLMSFLITSNKSVSRFRISFEVKMSLSDVDFYETYLNFRIH
jgi:hypothetical protein